MLCDGVLNDGGNVDLQCRACLFEGFDFLIIDEQANQPFAGIGVGQATSFGVLTEGAKLVVPFLIS